MRRHVYEPKLTAAIILMAALAMPAVWGSGLSGRGLKPVNTALSARAASFPAPQPENWRTAPEKAIDGDHESAWAIEGTPSAGSWFGLSWDKPVSVSQVLIRRNLRAPLKKMTLEARIDGTWKPLRSVGNGIDPLPKLILIEVATLMTDSIRVTDFTGTPGFHEVEVYERANPPVISLAGDAAGRIVGAVTDALGTVPLSGLPVEISGRAGGRPWRARASSDENGMFEIEAPAGLEGRLRVAARSGTASIAGEFESSDLALRLTPPDASVSPVDLKGTWKFAPDPDPGFVRPDFDDSGWKPIEVPSHWELAGFKPLRGEGGYRRRIDLPASWAGRRVKIRFDGVYSGAEVWLNGLRVGGHEGGFTPFEVDGTGAARTGSNLVAVRVTSRTKSSSLDNMSLYADFDLGGIIRKASFFSVPAAHIERLHVATRFDAFFRDATLRVDLKVVNEGSAPRKGEVRWTLASPDGSEVPVSLEPVSFVLPAWGRLDKTLEIPVPAPQHWEAEHPRLYVLKAALHQDDAPAEAVDRRFGFRQVDVRGTELLINGVPVKLRGTCHHDSDPVRGRAVTPDLARLDLRLIREANLDALRTSHYPAAEELIDGADEMGVYVEEEAPNCWVDQAYDLRLAPLIIQHTAELLERDRSHPSVIIWSLANESEWGPDFDRSLEYVKRWDGTRPASSGGNRILDLAIRHNPISLERMKESSSLERPLIWDESLCVFQGIWKDGLELWRDPGNRDYWIVPLIPIWKELRSSRVIQGSMIWAWADDVFRVPGRGLEHGRYAANAHDIDAVYGGAPGHGLVGDGPWGIVDGWRRRKPEFWHTKKLHSPVKITTPQVPVPEPGAGIRLAVENRYEFTDLSELSLRWSLGPESGEIRPRLGPGRAGIVEIPVRDPGPGRLMVRFFDSAGGMIDEEAIVVVGDIARPAPATGPAPALRIGRETSLSGHLVTVSGEGFELAFDQDDGGLRRAVAGGRMVISETPTLHLLPTDAGEPEEPFLWSWNPTGPLTARPDREDVIVTAPGKYGNADGRLVFRVTPSGVLEISYDFKYTGPITALREIGIRLTAPLSMQTLAWKRRGEWSTYPPDHIGRNEGKAQAHPGFPPLVPPPHAYSQDDSPMGSNDFRSTKRHIERASLTDADGFGFSVESNGEQHLRAAVGDHGVAVYISDWFGGTAAIMNEWISNYGKGRQIKPGDSLRGTIRLRLEPGRAVIF